MTTVPFGGLGSIVVVLVFLAACQSTEEKQQYDPSDPNGVLFQSYNAMIAVNSFRTELVAHRESDENPVDQWQLEFEAPSKYRITSRYVEREWTEECTLRSADPLEGTKCINARRGKILATRLIESVFDGDSGHTRMCSYEDRSACEPWTQEFELLLQAPWLHFAQDPVNILKSVDDPAMRHGDGDLHITGHVNPARIWSANMGLPLDEEVAIYNENPVKVEIWIEKANYLVRRMVMHGYEPMHRLTLEQLQRSFGGTAGPIVLEETATTLDVDYSDYNQTRVEMPAVGVGGQALP